MEHNLQPKHTHYVSLDNGSIHPAMTSPSGYEDQHLTEWRPASAAEIAAYNYDPNTSANIQPISLSGIADTSISSPSTLQLEPETPPVHVPPIPVTPAPVQEAPLHAPIAPAPAPAPITPAPVAPAPAIAPAIPPATE